MAASNQASVEVVKLLIEAYPDALHLQNDDGMTPLDLALGDESASEAIIALLEGRPAPPELSQRQKAEKFMERADALEKKLVGLRGTGGRQGRDFKDAVAAVRRLADCYPQALYSAGIDPNELEIALSNAMVAGAEGSGRRSGGGNAGDAARKQQMAVENAILDAVKKRDKKDSGMKDRDMEEDRDDINDVRDRVEDLISSIVGLEHVKCQVSLSLMLLCSLIHLQLAMTTLKLTNANVSSSTRFVVYEELLKYATCVNPSFPTKELASVASLPPCLVSLSQKKLVVLVPLT